MSEAITRVTLFVPGTPTSMDGWRDALAGADCTAEWIANDGHFGEAFGFGTVAPELVARIDRAPGALVLLWPADLRTGRAAIVAAVTRLRDAGALAVRLEESKLGWDVDTWLELFGADDPWAWHRGAVAFLRDADALLVPTPCVVEVEDLGAVAHRLFERPAAGEPLLGRLEPARAPAAPVDLAAERVEDEVGVGGHSKGGGRSLERRDGHELRSHGAREAACEGERRAEPREGAGPGDDGDTVKGARRDAGLGEEPLDRRRERLGRLGRKLEDPGIRAVRDQGHAGARGRGVDGEEPHRRSGDRSRGGARDALLLPSRPFRCAPRRCWSSTGP